MSIEDSDAALRIVEAGRQRVLNRLRDAFAHQAATHADLGELDPAVLDRLVHEAADQAGTSVWRIALAEGAADEYGVEVGEALAHPAVAAAEQLIGPAEQPGVPSPIAGAPADSTGTADAPSTPAYEPPPPPPGAADEPDVYDPWGLSEEQDEQSAPDDDSEGGFVPDPEPEGGFVPDPEPEGGFVPDPEPEGGFEPDPEPEPAYEPPTAVHQSTPEPGYEPEPEPSYEPGPELTSEPEPEPAPTPEPEPEPAAAPAAASDAGAPQALRIPAVHTSGIETLKQGDKDLELRLSDAGLDVLRQSTGVAIGRLDWAEITRVEVEEVKKGLRGRKVSQTLQVKTSRGQATFELPGLTEEESSQHLQPMLDRLRSTGMLAADAS